MTAEPIGLSRSVLVTGKISGPGEGFEIRLNPARLLRRLCALTAIIIASIEAGILYRLWCQLAGAIPSSNPLAGLYSVTGLAVDPFRGLDTVGPIPATDVLELPALIALEAYLAGGALVIGALWGFSAAFAAARSPVVAARLRPREYAASLVDAGRALWAALRRAAAAAQEAWLLLRAYVETTDWPVARLRALSYYWMVDGAVEVVGTAAGSRACRVWLAYSPVLASAAATAWRRVSAIVAAAAEAFVRDVRLNSTAALLGAGRAHIGPNTHSRVVPGVSRVWRRQFLHR